MSMSVLLIMVVVTKSVPTLLGHFSVAVTVDSLPPTMEGLALKLMSVHLVPTTVNSAVSTLMVDLDVSAMLDTRWTPIKQHVLVSYFQFHSGVLC